jgi:hypothetical protein
MAALSIAFLAATLAIGQSGNKVEPKAPTISPKAILRYFVGDWKGVGSVGKENSLRTRAEWDLNQTIVVARLEWKNDKQGGADLIVHSWDVASGRLLSKVYTTLGVQGEWTQTVEPDGRFFRIAGTFQGFDNDKKATGKVIMKIEDENHYTSKISNVVVGGEKKPDQEVRWTRLNGPAFPR